MALSDDERETVQRLSSALGGEQRELERLDAYYEGVHRLERLGLAVPPELERFVTTVNWPRVTADSVEQRCDIEGFRLPGQDDTDEELWSVWQANGMDEQSQQAHLDAMVLKRSYVCIGTRGKGALDDDVKDPSVADDVPLMTVESPFEMIHEEDPRSRMVTAALRRTQGYGTTWGTLATLYLPRSTVWLELKGSEGWVEIDRDPHNLGVVPVIPLINRARLRRGTGPASSRRRQGVSEMADVILLTDAACRALTNAQVATEVMAIPQRHVAGASEGDFVDSEGKPLTAWESYFGAVWATANEKASFGQFQAADLKNFETIVNHYANLASGVSGLPTRFYGQYTTNPPSEGSIVADETRLIMNAYRKHRGFGGSWEWGNRIVRRFIDGDWNPDLARMETLWRNPETPTRAQTADAAVKLYQAKITTKRQARRDVGYSSVQIANMERDDEAERILDPLAAAAEAFRTTPAPPPGTDDETVASVTPDGSTRPAPAPTAT